MNPLRDIMFAARRRETLARIARFPWHAVTSHGGWELGVPPEWLTSFCHDWAERHDWEGLVRKLDRFAHISSDGLHAFHLPGHSARRVVVLLHGWPSTALEFAAVAKALHGRGLSVLVPSLPGYPLSAPCSAPIGPSEGALAILRMIARAGYGEFAVHGGDWGAEIAVWMGLLAPRQCQGVHLGMRGMAGNAPASELHTAEERAWKEKSDACYRDGGTYMELQTREPLTLGYALADSPVAMAAWICGKFLRWADGRGQGPPGAEAIIGRDLLLDTVTLYAVTESGPSSLWLYPGYTQDQQVMPHRLEAPTAIFALPNDPVFPWPPASLLARHYNVVQWTDPPHGAHFAALETPGLLVDDLLAFMEHLA